MRVTLLQRATWHCAGGQSQSSVHSPGGGVGLGVAVALTRGLGVGLGVDVGLPVAEGLGLDVGLPVAEGLGLPVAVGDTEGEPKAYAQYIIALKRGDKERKKESAGGAKKR